MCEGDIELCKLVEQKLRERDHRSEVLGVVVGFSRAKNRIRIVLDGMACTSAKRLFAFHNPHKTVASNNQAFRRHGDVAQGD
jgi:hypothetical protein